MDLELDKYLIPDLANIVLSYFTIEQHNEDKVRCKTDYVIKYNSQLRYYTINGFKHGKYRLDNRCCGVYNYTYSYGLLHGPFNVTENYVAKSGEYRYGQLHGIYKEYDRNKDTTKIFIYDNGKRVKPNINDRTTILTQNDIMPKSS